MKAQCTTTGSEPRLSAIKLSDTGMDLHQSLVGLPQSPLFEAASTIVVEINRTPYILKSENETIKLPSCDILPVLKDFLSKNIHCSTPIIQCYGSYFSSQQNCQLYVGRQYKNQTTQSIIYGNNQGALLHTVFIYCHEDTIVAKLQLHFDLKNDGVTLIPEINLEKSQLTNINVVYLWRLVKILHVGSFDVDGTLIHHHSNESHDTPEKLIAENTTVVDWAKTLGIATVMSGSNRQSIVRENLNRQTRKERKLYSGSSIQLLTQLAQTIGAEFDGIPMADATNCWPPGTHYQYLSSTSPLDDQGYLVIPENFIEPLLDDKKILLVFLQVQHIANKFRDNPHLNIVFHFLDDEDELILKPLNDFYSKHLRLLPLRLCLRLWFRNPKDQTSNAIQAFSKPIQGFGLTDPNFLESVLYMPNFSPVCYEHEFYPLISQDAKTQGSSSNLLNSSVFSQLMSMPPLGRCINLLNIDGIMKAYTPSQSRFYASPDDFKGQDFILWQLRLRLKRSLVDWGFEENKVSMNFVEGENMNKGRAVQLLLDQFYTTNSAATVCDTLSKIVIATFSLYNKDPCLRIVSNSTALLSNILKRSFIIIDLEKFLEILIEQQHQASNVALENTVLTLRNSNTL
jgi:hypothetical protein